MSIQIKRVYDKPAASDGCRVLVDRIWPRGLRKEDAKIDVWLKEMAPTTTLRKWFGHDPAKWDQFRRKYFQELDRQSAPVSELAQRGRKSKVTLVFGAHDLEHNNAMALKEYLEK
jgi:uncharacterized protein YeaO (DUF488 family)